MKKINVVIYGATGSIGRSTLSIISKNLEKINIEGITCNKNILKLLKIAKSYNVLDDNEGIALRNLLLTNHLQNE